MNAISELYEPFIERDLEAIPPAIRRFRSAHSSDELWAAVARFAVLAYAPSQHLKHALLAVHAAKSLQPLLGDRFDELVTECAIYAAGSRAPWSEPPIGDPPPLEHGQRTDSDELREAVAARDRLRAERWLAARVDDSRLAADLFCVATDDFEDFGHKLIVAVSAWRLAAPVPAAARFAALRPAVWELVSYCGPRYEERGGALEVMELYARLMDRSIAEEGSIASTHSLFLLDAAMAASGIAGDDSILRRVGDYLSQGLQPGHTDRSAPRDASPVSDSSLPIYRLARDYAQYLKVFELVSRLRDFDALPLAAFLSAAAFNLASAPSFEEWSFA
jgi:hypothetical protein